MHPIIRYSIIALISLSGIYGQNPLENKLVQLEERIYNEKNDTARNSLIVEKMYACINAGDFSDTAAMEAARVNPDLISDTVKRADFFWNAALLCHLAGNYYRATFYANRYIEVAADSGATALLLATIIENGQDSAAVSRNIRYLERIDTNFRALECMLQVAAYERSGRRAYIISSAILPGLGSIANGNVLKGATSLLVFTGIGASVYLMGANHLYISAVLWGVPTLLKFYPGNLRLTGKLFDEKEAGIKNKLANDCELEVSKLIKKYPMNFRMSNP